MAQLLGMLLGILLWCLVGVLLFNFLYRIIFKEQLLYWKTYKGYVIGVFLTLIVQVTILRMLEPSTDLTTYRIRYAVGAIIGTLIQAGLVSKFGMTTSGQSPSVSRSWLVLFVMAIGFFVIVAGLIAIF